MFIYVKQMLLCALFCLFPLEPHTSYFLSVRSLPFFTYSHTKSSQNIGVWPQSHPCFVCFEWRASHNHSSFLLSIHHCPLTLCALLCCHPILTSRLFTNEFVKRQRKITCRLKAPARPPLFVGRNDDHFDRDRCPQQIDHLLVSQRHCGHLADLHQPTALPQSGLPGKAVFLHL